MSLASLSFVCQTPEKYKLKNKRGLFGVMYPRSFSRKSLSPWRSHRLHAPWWWACSMAKSVNPWWLSRVRKSAGKDLTFCDTPSMTNFFWLGPPLNAVTASNAIKLWTHQWIISVKLKLSAASHFCMVYHMSLWEMVSFTSNQNPPPLVPRGSQPSHNPRCTQSNSGKTKFLTVSTLFKSLSPKFPLRLDVTLNL